MQHQILPQATCPPKLNSSEYCRNHVAQQIVQLVSQKENIPKSHLLHRSRLSRRAAEGRRLAMYLIHVCCGLNLTETGAIFVRDRTTVRHACARVEDKRDDWAFDEKVSWFEEAIQPLIEADRLAQQDAVQL